MKEKLLKSIKGNDDKYDRNLEKMDQSVIKLENVVIIIKCYDEIIKSEQEKIINLVAKQGQKIFLSF